MPIFPEDLPDRASRFALFIRDEEVDAFIILCGENHSLGFNTHKGDRGEIGNYYHLFMG